MDIEKCCLIFLTVELVNLFLLLSMINLYVLLVVPITPNSLMTVVA